MKYFLSALALTASFGLWMAFVASSQLAMVDQASAIETVSGAYSNPINRRLKQDRLDIGVSNPAKASGAQKGNFCDVGGFDRACKFQIAGLKVSPPLVLVN